MRVQGMQHCRWAPCKVKGWSKGWEVSALWTPPCHSKPDSNSTAPSDMKEAAPQLNNYRDGARANLQRFHETISQIGVHWTFWSYSHYNAPFLHPHDQLFSVFTWKRFLWIQSSMLEKWGNRTTDIDRKSINQFPFIRSSQAMFQRVKISHVHCSTISLF